MGKIQEGELVVSFPLLAPLFAARKAIPEQRRWRFEQPADQDDSAAKGENEPNTQSTKALLVVGVADLDAGA